MLMQGLFPALLCVVMGTGLCRLMRDRDPAACAVIVSTCWGFFFFVFFVGQNFFFSPVKAKQRRLNPE